MNSKIKRIISLRFLIKYFKQSALMSSKTFTYGFLFWKNKMCAAIDSIVLSMMNSDGFGLSPLYVFWNNYILAFFLFIDTANDNYTYYLQDIVFLLRLYVDFKAEVY